MIALPANLVPVIKPYWDLMRLHRPIGILLLLWPTWWALWLAADGFPDWTLLIIFTLGVAVMRSAGCVINDIADRNIDPQVERTRNRPLATGELNVNQALALFAGLLVFALILVLMTNKLTILLALVALALAAAYPFAKRYTYLPQVVLGAAFSMGIPMAFTAQTGTLAPEVVLIYVTNLLWTVAYDTFYGMADREYDKKAGVKSTAILFEGSETIIVGSIQLLAVIGWWLIGQRFDLSWLYWLGLTAAVGLMFYQHLLIKRGQPKYYLAAFMNNNWVGLVIFLGLVFSV